MGYVQNVCPYNYKSVTFLMGPFLRCLFLMFFQDLVLSMVSFPTKLCLSFDACFFFSISLSVILSSICSFWISLPVLIGSWVWFLPSPAVLSVLSVILIWSTLLLLLFVGSPSFVLTTPDDNDHVITNGTSRAMGVEEQLIFKTWKQKQNLKSKFDIHDSYPTHLEVKICLFICS